MQIHIYVSRKPKTKLYEKPTDCKTLFHSHSHNPLSCKEGIIYSQLLQYSIISEDHILQEELKNLTRILLAHAYPLHLIIKNIKKAWTHNRINLLSQRSPQTVTNILPITIHKNWHTIANNTTLSTIWPCKPLSRIPNPATFTTILSSEKGYCFWRQNS